MLKHITKRHFIGGGFALIVLIVAFAVIWGAWRDSITGAPVPLNNPTEIYSEAVAALRNQENVYYKVTGSKSTTVGTASLKEEFIQLITCQAQGSDQMRICVEEVLSIGNLDINRFEYFVDGTRYSTVQSASFQAPAYDTEFTENFAPIILLDPSIYTEIDGHKLKKDTIIKFSNPEALEAWAASDDAELISAEGSAKLNRKKELTSGNYTATYKLDNVIFTVQYTVEVLSYDITPVALPDNSKYTSISNINTPYMLEKACGYLMAMGNIQSQYTDTISCEAFGDERKQTISLSSDTTDSLSVQVDTSVTVTNSSKAGIISTFSKTERFADNGYSSSTDGGEYISNPDVSQSDMNSYCQNLLIGTLMLPQHITAVELQDVDDLYSISFQASEEFAKILAEEACTTLYQSPSVLTDLAQSYATDTVTCYLNINKNTGIPLSSGFYYQGTYTISNLPYCLSFKADQTYKTEIAQ